jgi:hypothetical protein
LIGIEWVTEDFTKGELQQSWRTIVLDLQKGPLQGSYSVPAVSALGFYCNVKVNTGCLITKIKKKITVIKDEDLLTEKIIGCAYKVHGGLGPGFNEGIHHNALKIAKVGLLINFWNQV